MKNSLLLILIVTNTVFGQNGIGIGTSSPNPSAILDIAPKNNKGVLIPSLSELEIQAIVNPPEGLLLHHKDQGQLFYFSQNEWFNLSVIPPGSIIMWNGSTTEIPAGWALCDGGYYDTQGNRKNSNSYIKTPDLRESFVVAFNELSNDYDEVGIDKGGSDYITIDTMNMPKHTHKVLATHNHASQLLNSKHTHSLNTTNFSFNNISGYATGFSGSSGYLYDIIMDSTLSNTHSITFASDTANVTAEILSTGGLKPHENRPSFYVLAFLMKL